MLRKHQQRFNEICQSINNGEKITDVIAFVTPGGGKSVYVSIASQLIKDDSYKLVWIAPRESLVSQAESGFRGDGIFDVGNHDIRIATNNGEKFRGNSGIVSTYQAVFADPESWIEISRKYKLILFLDEYDSLSLNSTWGKPIKEIYDNSFFRICATGTIDRSDALPLMFTPYNKDGSINFNDTESLKWIVYNKHQSIADKSTVPFEATLISGSGSYIDLSGITRNFYKFTGDGNQLLTAFKTGFAYQMFRLCLKDWIEYKKSNPWAKMIVLANNIDIAVKYNQWFRNAGYRFNIATSGDEKLSKETIRRFKIDNSEYGSYDGMIGIGKIYKGLDIKAATFLVFLINIRGKSWADQAIGRVQRAFKTKKKAFIYAPNDPKMKQILKQLECCEIKNAEFDQEPTPQSKPDQETTGPAQTIEALSSKAHLENLGFPEFQPPPVKQETQSEIESKLKKEINHIVNTVFANETNGNKKTKQRIMWMKIKLKINNGRNESGKVIKKSIDEMSIKELHIAREIIEPYMKR